MNFNDLIKYLTVQIVERMNQPRTKRLHEKKHKSSFSTHWFGLIPFSLKMMIKRFQKNI
ncbi:YqzE family protein [Tepidibacillus sp. LV47]|uniref:YqzE family protein n=1 Tax=Tepidibacillus sp. LV47 TaxID=3398228 RepID=UPI003AAFD849